jgi:HEAT repeat protein
MKKVAWILPVLIGLYLSLAYFRAGRLYPGNPWRHLPAGVTVQSLTRDLESNDPRRQSNAASLVRSMHFSDRQWKEGGPAAAALVTALKSTLKSPDPVIRIGAIEALGQLKDARADIENMTASDPDPDVRGTARMVLKGEIR